MICRFAIELNRITPTSMRSSHMLKRDMQKLGYWKDCDTPLSEIRILKSFACYSSVGNKAIAARAKTFVKRLEASDTYMMVYKHVSLS